MATATTADSSASSHRHDHDHLNHLHVESLPLIDLRLLSQSDLLSLSLCSSSSSFSSLSHLQHDADVSTPKIDRSVFNESAGSRKQTFSRLRLAPPRNHASPSSPSPPVGVPSHEQPLDEEDSQIVALLQSFFGGCSRPAEDSIDNDDNLVAVPIHYDGSLRIPRTTSSKLQHVVITAVGSFPGTEIKPPIPVAAADPGLTKRKRGRPRKNETNLHINAITFCNKQVVESETTKPLPIVTHENAVEKENAAKEEMVVGVAALGSAENPYGEELMRRTEGMETEAELLGFLEGLEGEWLSMRKKRRIVDASLFGEMLPKGWKLMLSVKKKAGHAWLACRRYISPNGQQFVSCKDVSSYLLSFFRFRDASHTNFSHIDFTENIISGKSADSTFKDVNNGSDLVYASVLPVSSSSAGFERQDASVIGDPGVVQTGKKHKCHKCTMDFYEPDELLEHLLSLHHKTPKRLRHGAAMSEEEVIMKNGKYECQFCCKIFEGRHSYNGHLGIHIKDYLKRIGASGGGINTQKSIVPASIGPNLRIQESSEISRHFVALANNTETTSVTNSAARYCKIQANSCIEICTGKWDRICSIDNDAMENEVAIVGESGTNVSSDAESALLNDENAIRHKPSDKTVALELPTIGISSLSKQESFNYYSLASAAARDKMCHVNHNQSPVPTSIMEEFNPEKGTERGFLHQKAKQNTPSDDVMKDRICSSTVEIMGINEDGSVGKDEPITGCNNSGYVDSAATALASIVADTMQERDFKGDLPLSTDEETRVSRSILNNVPINTSNYPKDGQSGNDDLTIHFDSNKSAEDAVTINDEGRSHRRCSVTPPSNEGMCLTKTNMIRIPKCTIKKPYQDKESESTQLALYGNEQSFDFQSEIVNVSTGRMDLRKHDIFPCYKNEFSGGTVFVAGRATNIESRTSNSFLLGPSANEKKISLNDNGVCNNTLEKLMQDRNSRSSFHRPPCHEQIYYDENSVNKVSCIIMEDNKHKEVKSISNGDRCIPFGHVHTIQDPVILSTMQGSCTKDSSIVLPKYQFMLNTRDNLADSSGSVVDELEQKRGSTKGSLSLVISEQVPNVEDNLNWFSTGRLQDERRLEHLENDRKNGLIIGFNDHNGANENSTSEFIWRTDVKDDSFSGFVDTSSQLEQSSNIFPSCPAISNTAESEHFENKFGATSGFEVLRSGSMENMEYNFLTSQMGSQSNESNIISYSSKMAPGFDLSVWPEKEALPLFPNTARSHQVLAACIWCRNEFYHEPVESDAQAGSMGFMCGDCKDKFSGQLNFL